MTKRAINLTFFIDPIDYNEAVDSPRGAIDLVMAILNREADFPPGGRFTIRCEGLQYSGDLSVEVVEPKKN